MKFREFDDFLTEILGEDGNLTGLLYLDTSQDMSEKLPFGLQEKWLSARSRYKEENNGRLPPFEYFFKFVGYEDKKWNDRSFMHQPTSTKPEGLTLKNVNNDRTFSVHKTNVSTIRMNKPPNDKTKTCQVHNKPSSLQDCRVIRNKRKRPSSRRKEYVSDAVLLPHTKIACHQ